MSLLDNPTDIIYVSGSVLDTETVIAISDESLTHVLSVNGQVGHVIIETGGGGGIFTGIDLSSYATIVNLELTGFNLQNQINDFYSSGFITGVNLEGYITGEIVRPTETGNFITNDQTGIFYPISNPNGYITGIDVSNFYTNDNPSGFINKNLPIEAPDNGFYGGVNGPIADISSGDSIENAFNKVEIIFGKLAPSKPLNLSSASFILTNSTYSAIEQGTSISRSNIINNAIPIGRATGFYNGDNGVLSSYINGVLSGAKQLTISNDVGVYSGLEIITDQDFWNNVPGRAGFWTYLSAYSKPLMLLNSGIFTLQLIHSETGPTNIITGYCDYPRTPTATISNAITGNCVTRNIDGVQSLNTNDPINVFVSTSNTVSAFYRSPMVTLSSSQTSSSNINTTGTPISGTNLNLSGTINVSASRYTSSLTVSAQSFNSAGGGSSVSNYGTNIYIDTVSSQPSSRRKAGVGQYPLIFGDVYANELLTINEELQLINGQIQYPPSTDYTSKIPSGPNYTSLPAGSYNGYRWVCFNMGTIVDKSAIILSFNNTSNFGSTTINADMAFYVNISGSLSTNGWVNANLAYPGVGNPTNNGDAALVVGSSTATSKYITFGSAIKNGTVWARVGFPANSSKRFGSLTLT